MTLDELNQILANHQGCGQARAVLKECGVLT